MKKIILYIAAIVISSILIYRFYYYFLYYPNNVTIIYYPELPPRYEYTQKMKIEFSIDDQVVYSVDSLKIWYNEIYQKTSWGVHSFQIKINSEIIEKKHFFVFPLKWITIEIIDEKNIFLSFHSYRPRFM